MSLGPPQLRASSIAVGTGSNSTITSALALSTLQDSYLLFAVSVTSGAVRTITTPPSGLTLLFGATQLGSTTAGGLWVYGGIVARGAASPVLVLSGANTNRWQVAEYLNVDPDNPIDTVTPAMDSLLQTSGAAGSLGSHSRSTLLADELLIAYFGGRGGPTGITVGGSGMSVEQAQATTSAATLGSYSGAYSALATLTPSVTWTGNTLGSTVFYFNSIILRPRQQVGWGLADI